VALIYGLFSDSGFKFLFSTTRSTHLCSNSKSRVLFSNPKCRWLLTHSELELSLFRLAFKDAVSNAKSEVVLLETIGIKDPGLFFRATHRSALLSGIIFAAFMRTSGSVIYFQIMCVRMLHFRMAS